MIFDGGRMVSPVSYGMILFYKRLNSYLTSGHWPKVMSCVPSNIKKIVKLCLISRLLQGGVISFKGVRSA